MQASCGASILGAGHWLGHVNRLRDAVLRRWRRQQPSGQRPSCSCPSKELCYNLAMILVELEALQVSQSCADILVCRSLQLTLLVLICSFADCFS